MAIFLAAVTAAIYAKPAFDEALARTRPAELELDVSVMASGVAVPPTSTDDGHVFRVVGACPRTIEIRLSLKNVGKQACACVFNFRVPEQCQLRPLDEVSKQHFLSSGDRDLELVPGLVSTGRYSYAQVVLPSKVYATYAAEISLPADLSSWPSGWPMRVIATGVNNQKLQLDFWWWVHSVEYEVPHEVERLTAYSLPQGSD